MSRYKISSGKRSVILKLGFELLIIVAGILIALAINAWEINRNDRLLEQEYLHRLLDDMETNLAISNELSRYHGNVVKNARLIYPMINNGAEIDEVPLMIIVRAYWASAFWHPQWIGGTHQELLSTGRYEIIRNPEIRTALLQYYEWALEDDAMLELASTAYRDAIRSEIHAELQLEIRKNCNPYEESCEVNADSNEIERLVDWLRANDELSRDITRVILQSYRVENEYLINVHEATEKLRGIIEAELEFRFQ